MSEEIKFNVEEEIKSLCNKNDILFVKQEEYNKLKNCDLLNLVYDKLLSFIDEDKNTGFYILDIKEPNTKAEYSIQINIKNDNLEKKIKKKYIKELSYEVFSLLLQKKRGEATELIVDEFIKENYIYVTRDDKNPEFYIYKEGIVKPEGRTYIDDFCRLILKNNYSGNLSNDVIKKIESDHRVDTDKFLNTNYVYEIPVQNGILNLKTKELSPFTPKKIFFNKLPIKYNPNVKSDKILKFLRSIVGPENVEVILQLFGFALVKDYFLEVAFMFVGDGRNGKGKLLELFKRFVGINNICSVRLQEMNTQSSSIWELSNRLVNLAGDLNNTSLKETGLFKELTGRDTIQAKRKYKNDLKFVNFAKNIFACNELPRIYDNSVGFWSRWILINFPYEFVDKEQYNKLDDKEKINKKIKNPNIIDEITTEQELSGLLNLALDGLSELLKNKCFLASQTADEVKRTWQRKSDSFVAFCMDNIEEDYEGKISKKKLKLLYNKYRKEFKLKNSSDISIKITLEDRYGVSESQESSTGNRFWDGIKLKNNSNNNNNIYSPKSLGSFSRGFIETPVTSVSPLRKEEILPKKDIDFNNSNILEENND